MNFLELIKERRDYVGKFEDTNNDFYNGLWHGLNEAIEINEKQGSNKYERMCKEWLKGCSCADKANPEECKECTKAFLDALKTTQSSQ